MMIAKSDGFSNLMNFLIIFSYHRIGDICDLKELSKATHSDPWVNISLPEMSSYN